MNVEALDSMSSADLAKTFRAACDRAGTALSALVEVLDYGPAVGEDGLKAFQSVKDHYQRMMRLARSVNIEDK